MLKKMFGDFYIECSLDWLAAAVYVDGITILCERGRLHYKRKDWPLAM